VVWSIDFSLGSVTCHARISAYRDLTVVSRRPRSRPRSSLHLLHLHQTSNVIIEYSARKEAFSRAWALPHTLQLVCAPKGSALVTSANRCFQKAQCSQACCGIEL